MATDPLVDAVIAVHDPSRPIARAVASLQRSGLAAGTGLRITVVCHNIAVDAIAAQLPDPAAPGLRLMHLEDGIHSAAGPFNAGLAAATAPYVTIMGSDDSHQPGAIAAWLAAQPAPQSATTAPKGSFALPFPCGSQPQ